MKRLAWLAIASVALTTISPIAAADEPDGPDAAELMKKSSGKGKKDGIKSYDEVIPDSAKTKRGVFLVHQVDDKLFYEIPQDALGGEFLWVVQIAQTQAGYGLGGTPVGDRVVRWELRDEKILLRDVRYLIRADVEDSIRTAVAASSLEPIIETFPVKAWGKDKAPVIEVTSLFTGDVDAFSAKRRLNASGVDKNRTFIEQWKAFPENLETRVLTTYKTSGGGSSRFGGPRGPVRPDSTLDGVTALIHHSMVKLPDDPMRPRERDSRIGYFSVAFEDYTSEDHQVDTISFINRWRLEKKDPKAAVSEPKKPIVFYVGRGVPEKWRSWVKQGVESWQPAFEAAGFKSAIIAKDAPSEREDPDWDAEDARYSTIRWLPSTIENAMGPHVHDPRTGEILEADILVYHNILKLVRDWYFVQASPMDERAQALPMPDDLIGELLAYVIAHEVGHSLGFMHNMKASSAYSVEQLRDPEFTARYGTEASIMDYGRFNYVCQPGDGARLIPIIGPYDFFAVEWGYKDLGTTDRKEEKRLLDELASMQVDDPKLRFGDPNPSEDPSQQTEDLGSDPILATSLGIENIDRVASFLVEACCEPGDDYALLKNMYDELLGQRDRELGHVANLVGGMVGLDLRFGQGDRVFEPVAAEQQRAAVAFLIEHGLNAPSALITPAIVDRLSSHGIADRILRSQRRVLDALIDDGRINRISEHVERFDDTYAPAELLAQLRDGVWSELSDAAVRVDLYRRNLQRAHVEILSADVGKPLVDSDLPALARGELSTLQALIRRALPRAADETTLMHLEDVRHRVDTALEPRSAQPEDAPGVGRGDAPSKPGGPSGS